MVLKREPVQIVEIDIDFCTLTYGTGACTAVLGTTGVRKCYNSWNTCQVKDVYDKGSLTLRFVNSRSNLPLGATYFPTLKSVSAFSSSVNIAGSNPKLGTLGKRGKVTVDLEDFPYHDRYTDKYAGGRVDGTAQTDESGYSPADRGTFWTKFKKRHPNFAGRPLRVLNGYILEDGTYSIEQTRNFVITDIIGPDDKNKVTVEAKDILTLAEKKSAVAPVPSNGSIAIDLEEGTTEFDLEPAGIGESEYPEEGYAIVGSEVMAYTRIADTITVTERAAKRTELSSHSEGDTFQQVIVYEDNLISEVVDDLLTNYTSIDASFIPSSDYTDEVARWAPTTKINTVISEPTAVSELLGELSTLGASIWWDDVEQEIRLRMNHPIDIDEVVPTLTDDDSIKAISQKGRDEDRITQVHFYTVQSNPTDSPEDKSNFDRITVTIDADSEREENFGESRVREVFCRWLNTGNDAIVRIVSQRLLQRFIKAPQYTQITLDAKDIDLSLNDVIGVSSRVLTDETGAPVTERFQIIEKTETKSGHEVKITTQAYQFDDFYGFIMENSATTDYDLATEAEKEDGCYIIAEADESFTDNRPSYKII